MKPWLYVLLGGVLGVCIRTAFPQDGTAGPPVILRHYSPQPTRIYANAAAVKPERMELFRFTDPVPVLTISLAAAPAMGTVVKVYRNGMLLAPDTDYTTAGNVVTVSLLSQGDVIQVLYTPL